MKSTSIRRISAVALALGLVATGCGSDEDGATGEPAATGARPGSDLQADEGSTEVDGPQPRLVVSDADSGRVDVLDLESGENIATFDVQEPSRLTDVGGRYAFATAAASSGEDGRVHVIDVGSWTIDHGDHTHSYVRSPAELGVLSGDDPAHIVAGDGKVAVFFDGEGEADVLDNSGLRNGDVTVTGTVETGGPHHGVVIPVSDHFVTSRPSGEADDSRPSSFELRDGGGEFVQEFTDFCPRMHGQAAFRTYAIAACDDGVFVASVADGQWISEKVGYPPGITAETRPSSFRTQDKLPVVVAPAGPAASNAGILLFDTATRQWSQIATPEPVLSVNLSGDGRNALAVLADRTFRVYDAATGEETGSSSVLAEPFDPSDRSATAPVVVVGGNRAYVADPAAEVVLEIDYRDGARVARTLDVGVAPASMTLAGF
ncbi:ABC transporter [Rhodococcus triatomae]|uniref:ABC transporter n=1 Tax=Rhodococcus triatomae TaxID=300028 RepID=A0A1G8CHY0_9NOCA|nr:ABC transporter [Rhodococcus triatomae]QNG18650.1 ABC transporter [Rhodococcus triatomae]QNG21680.1 ABC transporter [Rhodococcus triatomae]SDH45047.1 hypothetical protein SAMN05444695_10229 [Rhodococcus triatomae]